MRIIPFIKPNKILLPPSESLKLLSRDISDRKLFGIGEVHGVKDNVDLYFTVLQQFNFESIALEYPVDCILDLMNFIKNDVSPRHWFFQEINDGRFSYEMLSMLKLLYESGKLKKIICYDKRKDTIDWNSRDKDYADAFLENYDPNFKMLITGGNYHVKSAPFKSPNEKGTFYPMCWHLKEKLGNFPTAKIVYVSGEFFNFEKQSFQTLEIPDKEVNVLNVGDLRYEFILKNVKAIDN